MIPKLGTTNKMNQMNGQERGTKKAKEGTVRNDVHVQIT